MKEWSTKKKTRFRGEVLSILSGHHLAQGSRLDDVQLCLAVQTMGWDCEMRDIVTILQDMQGRGWVKYEWRRSKITQRVELFCIEICPDGQDLVDEVTRHAAVSFL
jgi:hypothetical protein